MESKSSAVCAEAFGIESADFTIPNYGAAEMTKFSELQQKNILCDACLVANSDNTKIFAHRIVLSVAGKYFSDIFNVPHSSNAKLVASFEEVSGPVLSKIVHFIYTGKINVTLKDAEELLKWSNVYGLPALTETIEGFLVFNVNMKNFVIYGQLGSDLNCRALKAAVDKFVDTNFMEIRDSKELKQMEVKQLKRVLCRSSLQCNSEEDVFIAVKQWQSDDPQGRESHLIRLLPCIRFALLSPDFICEHIDAFIHSKDALVYCLKALAWLLLKTNEKDLNKYSSKLRVFTNDMKTMEIKESPATYVKAKDISLAEPIAFTSFGIHKYDNVDRLWSTIVMLRDTNVAALGQRLAVTYKKNGNIDLIDVTSLIQIDQKVPMLVSAAGDFAAVCIVGKKIYFISGSQNSTGNYVYVLNSSHGRIYKKPSFTIRRSSTTAVLFRNCIYVVGGFYGCDYIGDVEKFDILTETWSSVAALNVARKNPVCIVYDDQLYAIGGSYGERSAEVYNSTLNEWTKIADVPKNLNLTSAVIVDDKLIVVNSDGRTFQYNKNANNWKRFTRIPE